MRHIECEVHESFGFLLGGYPFGILRVRSDAEQRAVGFCGVKRDTMRQRIIKEGIEIQLK